MYPDTDLVLDDERDENGDSIISTTKNLRPSVGKLFEEERAKLLPQKPLPCNRTKMICPKCQNSMTTKIKTENSVVTYLFCFLLCFSGLSTCCCCCIPFCMNSCQKVQHNCSQCKVYLGHYLPR